MDKEPNLTVFAFEQFCKAIKNDPDFASNLEVKIEKKERKGATTIFYVKDFNVEINIEAGGNIKENVDKEKILASEKQLLEVLKHKNLSKLLDFLVERIKTNPGIEEKISISKAINKNILDVTYKKDKGISTFSDDISCGYYIYNNDEFFMHIGISLCNEFSHENHEAFIIMQTFLFPKDNHSLIYIQMMKDNLVTIRDKERKKIIALPLKEILEQTINLEPKTLITMLKQPQNLPFTLEKIIGICFKFLNYFGYDNFVNIGQYGEAINLSLTSMLSLKKTHIKKTLSKEYKVEISRKNQEVTIELKNPQTNKLLANWKIERNGNIKENVFADIKDLEEFRRAIKRESKLTVPYLTTKEAVENIQKPKRRQKR